jgi:hypothetical protein
MSLLDAIVGRAFRNEKAGRVVVFTGDRRHRGYIVRCESDELRIRSFLKMFYFAHFSILVLGMLVANAWSSFVIHIDSLGRPAEHLLRTQSIFIGIYSIVVGLPYFLLGRSHKRSLSSFVSSQDEVLVSGTAENRQSWITYLAIIVFITLVLSGVIFYLIQRR